MSGYTWTRGIRSNRGLGFPALPAVLTAVTWIVDPIVAGVGPEAGKLTAMMTRPSTVGTTCLFALAAAVMAIWSRRRPGCRFQQTRFTA